MARSSAKCEVVRVEQTRGGGISPALAVAILDYRLTREAAAKLRWPRLLLSWGVSFDDEATVNSKNKSTLTTSGSHNLRRRSVPTLRPALQVNAFSKRNTKSHI